MDSRGARKEYSCAVDFLTDLISIIIDVETWNELLALYPPRLQQLPLPGRNRLCQVYKISLGIKLLGSLWASLNCLKGTVGIFLQLKQTGKLLARQRTNITPLCHLHFVSFQDLPDMMYPLLNCFTKHFNSKIGEAVLGNMDIICHNTENGNLEGLFKDDFLVIFAFYCIVDSVEIKRIRGEKEATRMLQFWKFICETINR